MKQYAFTDPISGETRLTPWSRDEAIRHGRPTYLDRDGCVNCDTTHPKARYVEDDGCVGCFMKHELEVFDLWMQGLPGRPEPFCLSANQASAAGQSWYFGPVSKSIVCLGGPHFRRTDVLTGRCIDCDAKRDEARALARGPRAIARAAGHTTYEPTDACPECGQLAPRNVVTNKCSGCARPPGRPPGQQEPSAPRPDMRRTPTSIMVEQYPDMTISRDDARAFGFTQYRTGEPCRRGHRGWRYVSVGTCIPCARGER